MCVICHKPEGVRFPSEKNVREMWEDNPHGAGVMWREGRRVRWRKGFMKLEDLESWLAENRRKLEKTECALHFRITTHGGTSPGNCHPFPVGGDPHALEGSARFVLMHNGILPFKPRRPDVSDTGELALRLASFSDPAAALGAFDEALGHNRIVVMGAKGTFFFGEGFVDSSDPENARLKYSNLNWEGWGAASSFSWNGKGWLDPSGRPVAFDDVDPYSLDDESYDAWESQASSKALAAAEYGLTEREYIEAEKEADDFGMTVGEYLEWGYGGGVKSAK